MGTAAANRQAIWDREKAERKERPPVVAGYKPPERKTFHLGASSAFAVCKVFEDGRLPIVIKARMTVRDAEDVAGHMRDGMTDEEVGRAIDEGWSYSAVRIRGTGARQVANPDDGVFKAAKAPPSVPLRR